MRNGTVNLHGREYKTVALRVAEFRAEYPIAGGWCISAEPIEMGEKRIIFRAAIRDPEGREVASGYAEEVRSNRGINSTSALENCETSAIGRALAAAGYAGQEYASAEDLKREITAITRHPSFDAKRFGARLSEIGLTYARVVRWTTEQGWGRPSAWAQPERDRLIADLASQKASIE